MKATILSSVFALAIVACVQPADPEPAQPQTGVTEQSFVGFPSPRCVYVSIDNWPCE